MFALELHSECVTALIVALLVCLPLVAVAFKCCNVVTERIDAMPADTSPFWLIAKAVVLLAFAALFSWTNATNFDQTELTMLAEIAAVLFGGVFLELYNNRKNS